MDYPFYIGDTQITDGNIGSGSYSGVSYDANTYTITLNSANLTAPLVWADYNNDLTIKLQGTSTITVSDKNYCIDVSSKGDVNGSSTIHSKIKFEKGDNDCQLTLECLGLTSFYYNFSGDPVYSGLRVLTPVQTSGQACTRTIEAFYLTVAGTPLSRSNFPSGATTYEMNIGGGKITYDHANKILTLDNAYDLDYDAGNTIVYALDDDLTVKLKGANTIDCGSNIAFACTGGSVGVTATVGLTFETTSSDAGGLTMLSTNAGFATNITSYYSGFKAPTYKLNTSENLNILATPGTTTNKVTISFPYGLTVGNVSVNSANANNVLADDDANTWKVSYSHDAADNYGTLTLDGVTLNDDIINNALDKLTVHFQGANTIGAPAGCAIDSRNRINAELVFDGEVDGSTQATLDFYGNDPVEGFNTVSYASDTYLASSRPIQYKNSKMVDVLDASISPSPTITTVPAYPLWIYSSSGAHQATYKEAISANDLNGLPFSVSGTTNTLSLTNENLDGYHIVSGLDNLTVALAGTNSMKATSDATPIFNSYNSGALSFTISGTGDASLVMQNKDNGGTSIINGFSGLNTGTGLFWAADGTSTVSYGSTNGLLREDDTTPVYNATITSLSYGIWVAGTQVKSTNVNDVLSDGGTVSYDAATNLLTLDDAHLNKGISTTMADLNIHIKGTCWISSTNGGNSIRSTKNTGTLKFTKDTGGTLTLNTSSITIIRGFKTIDDVNGLPLETQSPYQIVDDGYYRLRKAIVNTTDTAATNIDYAVVSADAVYPLWISSKQVTSANKGNIVNPYGDATATYDETSKTLTLQGGSTGFDMTVVGGATNPYYGITSGIDHLKVNLISNNNEIFCQGDVDYAFKGYGNAQDVTFTTDESNPGSLTLVVKDANDNHWFDGLNPIYQNGLYRKYDGSNGNYYVSTITPAVKYDLWVQGTRVTSANASDIGDKNNYNIDISFDPVSSTLYYKSNGGGGSAQSVTSGLPNLIIKIGSPDTSSGIADYTKNNIGIIKFGAPTGETIAATSGTLTLSKEDGVTGVQQFDIVGYYGEPSLIQGFDDVDYGDFAILAEGATYNTQTKQLEYLKPDGSGNYIGLDNTTTFVTPQDLSSYYVANIANQDYAGSGLNAAITVKETETATIALVENTDYTVSYTLSGATATPKDANTYNVIINGKGRYVGSITNKTFTINPIAVGLSWSGTSFTFDGEAHKPTATATGLIGSDVCNVTVTGEQTNASETSYTATATALDNNNYKLPTTGLTQDFTISPCSLAYANIAVIPAETYSGSEIKPTPEVKITLGTSTSETTLSAETDFEYTYANNKNAAKASDNLPPTVTITGKGNYNGTRVVKFTIDPLTATLAWSNTTLTYDGSPQQPTAEVSNLISPDVCTVTVTGAQTNAGDYTATAISLSNTNYQLPTTGLTQDFTILDRTANITFNAGQTYKTFFSAGENLLVPNDVKAYVVTMVSGNTVNLTQISYIHSNVPVLLESSAGATNVKDPNESLPATNLLKYASAAVSTDGNQYVLYSGEFVKATGTIPADRVYLAYSSPVRRLTIERNNSATAIEAVSDEDADDEQWYDMQGRKINKPTKAGLYIKNGKKVVVNNK